MGLWVDGWERKLFDGLIDLDDGVFVAVTEKAYNVYTSILES